MITDYVFHMPHSKDSPVYIIRSHWSQLTLLPTWYTMGRQLICQARYAHVVRYAVYNVVGLVILGGIN